MDIIETGIGTVKNKNRRGNLIAEKNFVPKINITRPIREDIIMHLEVNAICPA